MTEYTPDTDQMRNVYASVQALGIRSGPPGAIEYNHGKAKFDRWLAEVKAEAWTEGFDKGFYRGQILHGDYDASEAGIENPYEVM